MPELVERALARRPSATLTSVPMGVLSVSLVAQWTAAVDLVLTEGMCLNDAPLRARILVQAYNGWWQGLGLPPFLEAVGLPVPAAAPQPAQVPALVPWLTALAKVVTPTTPAAPLPASRLKELRSPSAPNPTTKLVGLPPNKELPATQAE